MKYLVTVIIPMYNESMNIEKCIKNLCEQTNQNFEVIFVDDGSKDGTLQKLKGLLTTDIKFNYKIKSQKNKGAASARKNGIESAETQYIMMLDCDDMLSINAIEEVYSIYNYNTDVDVIVPNMLMQKQDGKWNKLEIYTDELMLDPIDCVKNSLGGWYIHGCLTIRKEIFLKSYKDYFKFNPGDENFINNDEVLTRLNFLNSRIIIRSSSSYFYYFNENSTTKKVNQSRYLMVKNAFILNAILIKYNDLGFLSVQEIISVIWSINFYKFQNYTKIVNINEWNYLIKESLNKVVDMKVFFRLSLKKRFQFLILRIIYLT